MADIKIQLYKKTGSNFDSILLQNADWYGIPNKPTTFTPTAHTHTISNITNLQGNWELLRTRGATSNLTDVNSGDSVGSVSLTKTLTAGDVLAIEVNTQSSYTFKPKIIIVNLNTLSSSPNSTSEYNLYDFSSFNGTNIRHNSFAISGSGINLYFGSKKYIQGAFSGSNIEWNTENYTLYVGRVWRLNLSTTYMVRFYDFQGTGNTLLKAETVTSGGNATPPADPVRTGYQFTGWSPPYTNITTNTDIYGQWVEAGPPANVVRFVSAEARTITPKYTNSGITLEYSVDSGATWTTIASGGTTTSATEHWFRGQATGTKTLFTTDKSTNAWAFIGSSDLEVYGNLNFLLCDALGDEEAPTSLGDYCYAYMFSGCISLIKAPELPATTLAKACYRSMFNGCTALTTAPELPATRLGEACYRYMFGNCTSLTVAPELPATTLAYYCYYWMFYGCTSFKVSATKEGAYQYAWRIPTSGTGTTATGWNTDMLTDTGGTFKGQPTFNTTYYVENKPV